MKLTWGSASCANICWPLNILDPSSALLVHTFVSSVTMPELTTCGFLQTPSSCFLFCLDLNLLCALREKLLTCSVDSQVVFQ
jgi:hypothetical protein